MKIYRSSIPLYGIIVALSVFIGVFYIYYHLKKEKISDKNILLYFVMYIFFAFVMGKMFTVVASNGEVNILNAGLSSYGGLIGVVIGSIIFEKILPCKNKIIKYTILSLPLVYGISKIACFITGCCYGIPYNGFGNVIYPDGLNIPLFPVQIVETIFFLIMFIVCNKFKNNKNIIYITLLLVSITKFSLDFLRYEHLTESISFNQKFSILLFLLTIIVFIVKKMNKTSK